MRMSFVSAVLSIGILAACHAVPSPTAEQELTLVLLKTGPRTDLGPEEQQKVFAGHFANMNRLAREGHLLLAGPFGDKRSDPALRGVFVFGTGDRSEAERLAATDPGVQAGVFVPEFHALSTSAPLRAMIAAELAAEDTMKAAGRTPKPGEFGRSYVLLTADEGDAAQSALRGNPAVLLSGRLDGRGAWIVLDAKDLAAAEAQLAPLADRLGPHHLDEWFATKRVADLPVANPGQVAKPRVLILGDSISIGYTARVQKLLADHAVVVRPTNARGGAENCAGTNYGVANLERWLALDGGHWDVIHFNFGLHDLKHVDGANGKDSNDPKDPRQAEPERYESQLRRIVERLEKTGAALVFATTTPVPPGDLKPYRDVADPARYNAIAKRITDEHHVPIDDLYALVEPRIGELLTRPDVHYEATGYDLLAEQVVASVQTALSKR